MRGLCVYRRAGWWVGPVGGCLKLVFLLFTIATATRGGRSTLLPVPGRVRRIRNGPFDLANGGVAVRPKRPRLGFTTAALRDVLGSHVRMSVPLSNSHRSPVQLVVSPRLRKGRRCRLGISRGKVAVDKTDTTTIFCNMVAISRILLKSMYTDGQGRVAPVDVSSTPHFNCQTLVLSPTQRFLPVRSMGFCVSRVMHCGCGILRLRLASSRK